MVLNKTNKIEGGFFSSIQGRHYLAWRTSRRKPKNGPAEPKSRQCDENSHDVWKSLIDKYEVSDEKKESLNWTKNRWNNCKIKDTSIYPDIWFNELYNLNLNFKNIKVKYKKYEDKLNAHVLDFLPE